MSESPLVANVSDDAFQEVINGDQPVLVDFWASWCGPCKAIAPVVEELAKDFEGKVRVAKLNIEENPHTPQKLGIKGIPTLILFKNGQVVDQVVGNVGKDALVELVNKAS
jgi:thioredoxin 1